MGTHHISLTGAKQNLGELVKRTAYGGERFVLEFRGKARAALVSCEDLERLEGIDTGPSRLLKNYWGRSTSSWGQRQA